MAHLEIAITAMVQDENGDCISWEALGSIGQWSHFDVDARRINDDGTIDILEEHEELKEDEANTVFDALCAKYPDADQSVNY